MKARLERLERFLNQGYKGLVARLEKLGIKGREARNAHKHGRNGLEAKI